MPFGLHQVPCNLPRLPPNLCPRVHWPYIMDNRLRHVPKMVPTCGAGTPAMCALEPSRLVPASPPILPDYFDISTDAESHADSLSSIADEARQGRQSEVEECFAEGAPKLQSAARVFACEAPLDDGTDVATAGQRGVRSSSAERRRYYAAPARRASRGARLNTTDRHLSANRASSPSASVLLQMQVLSLASKCDSLAAQVAQLQGQLCSKPSIDYVEGRLAAVVPTSSTPTATRDEDFKTLKSTVTEISQQLSTISPMKRAEFVVERTTGNAIEQHLPKLTGQSLTIPIESRARDGAMNLDSFPSSRQPPSERAEARLEPLAEQEKARGISESELAAAESVGSCEDRGELCRGVVAIAKQSFYPR